MEEFITREENFHVGATGFSSITKKKTMRKKIQLDVRSSF